MKKTSLFLGSLLLATTTTFGQIELKTIGTKVTEDFNGWTAKGFAPTPSAGQLSSENWSIKLSSSLISNFGATSTSNDFSDSGSPSLSGASAGLHSYQPDFDLNTDFFLGAKSSGSILTPGYFDFRIKNNTGKTITSIDVSYLIRYLNSGNRSNSMNLSYSTNGSTYTPVTELNFSTPEKLTSTSFQKVAKSKTISGLSIPCGNYFYLRWDSFDTGSDFGDDFGIDDLSLTPHGTVTSTCTGGTDPVDPKPTTTNELIITEFATEGAAEWVEIYNAGTTILNLKDYNITQLASSGALSTKYWLDAVDGTKTIAPGEYLVVIDNGDLEAAFTARWPSFNFSKAIVVTSLALSNGTTGDEIIISKKDASGSYVVVDQVDWISSTELKAFTGGTLPGSSTGETASRTNTDNTKSSDDVANWQLCGVGTPGTANTCSPTGISDVLLQVELTNNGNGTFNLQEPANVVVYNILGSVIYSSNNTVSIDISNQAKGNYIAVIEKDGKAAVVRLNK